MTEDEEKLLRATISILWSTADHVDQAVDGIVEFVRKMQAEEIELWKDRLQAAQQAHEATINQFEDETRKDW